ncbi:MAG: c-type cytochrome [Ahniella sp.]|nr:c-type cytochrome [Ahniella sp.]
MDYRIRAVLVLVWLGFASTSWAQVAPDPGRKVFDGQHCSRCHALAGKGNKLRPLDDIGLRLDAAKIRAAVTASAPVRPSLPARALVAKQKFAALPAAELDALITFLAAQKTKPVVPAKPK